MASTQLISGLVSGLDWRTIVDQLRAVDHKRVELVEDKKTEYENKLTEWQGVNTKLLALKTATSALATESAFKVFNTTTTSNTTTSASSLLTATTSSTASPGVYNIKVNNVAQSEKISSKDYASVSTALSLSGDMLVSGKVVNIASTDTLTNIRDKINAINTGTSPSKVTASIVQHSSTDSHLVLMSDETGSTGLSVLEGSSAGVLQSLGFITSSTQIKTATSDGAKGDLFSDSNTAVGTLLGLSSPGDATVTIGGNGVAINLATQSITTIASNIDALAGISASVVSEEVGGVTKYRIDISGTTSFTDNGNILQTLGILEGTYGTVAEVHTGSVSNTTDGTTKITASTQWNQIFGANVQSGTSFTITGKKHDGTAVSGSFTISGTTAQVNELLSYIQTTVFVGTVTATINSDGKIQITDTTSGDSQLEMTLITNNPSGGSLDFGTVSTSTEGRSMQITAGEDAELNIDNVIVKKASNTVSDLISGVTLSLAGESASTTVTLKVERDLDSIKSKITDLSNAYNDIMGYINTQFNYDDETKEVGGILFGDGTLSSVKSELINTVTQTVTGVSSNYNRLPLIGVSLDDDVLMTIDDSKLTSALQTNFEDVKKLFVDYGSSPSSLFEYIDHTDNTQGGTYSVAITQAATRTTVTGGTALAGTLSAGETLAITDYASGRVANVSLTAGMNIDDIVNAANSEFAKTYTEQLKSTSGDAAQSSSTLFSAVTGADNGDVITFSGKRRNGLSVSGSYTVNTTHTLGNLLSSIEDMFQDEVTVSLEAGTGKLVITDTQAGDSQLEFTIDTSAVPGLNFGTVSTTTAGRNAITITASKGTGGDANKLVLTHNTYGTGHPIVVSETGGTALGMASAVQVYGLNVAGTINGVAATGSGQTLTLSSSGNNADGLSITYSGTTTTTTAFTLSLGIADLLDRQLGFITNSTDGYVPFKQTSLQDSIDDFDIQIKGMEAQLDRKMESMINQFVAMEKALSQLQNQSSWLTAQINGLNKL